MTKIVTIHNLGLNNIDLEGRVEENSVSQQIKTVEMKVSGLFGMRTAFELPPGIGFEVNFGGKTYYARLDETDKGTPQKIFPNAKGGVTILADEKYNLTGRLETRPPEGIKDFWHITITEAVGGGGAHNTSFGQLIYLSEISNSGMEVRLIVPIGHSLIQGNLPPHLEYSPLYGLDNENFPMNINFAPVNGKKITLRSKTKGPQIKNTDLGISSGDVVVLNTVRDSAYLGLLEDVLSSNKEVRLFLAATDSMIQAIGKDKVLGLVKRSEVYVSNREELEKLVGTQINDAQNLVEKMNYIRSLLQTRNGSPGGVYITFGEYGSVVLGSDGIVYYQPVTPANIDPFKKLNIVNTNGCGDAYLAVVVIKEVLSHPSLEILNDANAAGHICAVNPTAAGTWMAGEDKIRTFRDSYGKPDFLRYDNLKREFVRMRI